jgi:CheY-like chemotaxis protein
MSKPQHKIIFLIDDDAISNFINTKIIQAHFPFTVVAFTNAMEALQELKQYQTSGSDSIPDLIFLDINMPVMDGWEFLDEFQKLPDFLLAKCNITMLTSSLDRDDIEKSKKYRCVLGFISKPLTVEILKEMEICVGNY